jgi:hypothetical protein
MSHGEQSYLSNCQRGYNRCSTRRTAKVGPNGPPTDTLGSARFLPREALPPGSGGMHAMRHANLENCAILAILERRESLSPWYLREIRSAARLRYTNIVTAYARCAPSV